MFASCLLPRLAAGLLAAATVSGCSSSSPVSPSRSGRSTEPPAVVPSTARPSIASLSAAPGSTGGGAPFTVVGTGFLHGVSVRFGSASAFASLIDGELKGTTPPHAAGIVDVTVTNPNGHADTLAGGYTYVAPGSLDFNGDWQGYGTEGETFLRFVVRDNVLVVISCGPAADAPTLTIAVSPPVPVSNGAVAFSGLDGLFGGRIVTATSASGTLSLPRCFAGLANWSAVKK